MRRMPDSLYEPLQQAGAIPYRSRSGELQFCLVTSLKKSRWGIPKGIIEPGDTPIKTAALEALEEAGVEGVIDEDPLGTYEYSKWHRRLIVTVFLMHVSQIHESWAESSQRSRCWVSLDEANELIANPDQRRLLATAMKRLKPE